MMSKVLHQFVKLVKSIYGLKQAGYLWNKLLTETLLTYGYIQTKADPCVFNYHQQIKLHDGSTSIT